MAKIVEQVVCCVGQSVQGNPTQFIMDRLVADAKVDWRFVTAEVAGPNVRVAVDGVRALNFDGLIFLQPVAVSYGLNMETYSEGVLRTGFLNVARRDHESWLAENIDGIAIASLIRDRGISGTIMVYGSDKHAHLLRIADSEIAKQLISVVDEESKDDKEQANGTASASIPMIYRNTLSESPQACEVLVVERQLTNLDVGLLRGSLSSKTAAIDLLGDQSSNREMLPDVQWVSEEVVLCYQLKSMFEFLTGQTAEIKAVQDYFDEYSSW